jgi:hypothetical protein
MKLILLISLLATSSILKSEEQNNDRFQDEIKFLEKESIKKDEVKIISSGLKKENQTAPVKDEDVFFKTEEVKPRRIRSR